jgi:hypothetical protein
MINSLRDILLQFIFNGRGPEVKQVAFHSIEHLPDLFVLLRVNRRLHGGVGGHELVELPLRQFLPRKNQSAQALTRKFVQILLHFLLSLNVDFYAWHHNSVGALGHQVVFIRCKAFHKERHSFSCGIKWEFN